MKASTVKPLTLGMLVGIKIIGLSGGMGPENCATLGTLEEGAHLWEGRRLRSNRRFSGPIPPEASLFNSVVFPVPFGPANKTHSPGDNSKEMSRARVRFPYPIVKLLT